MEHHEKVYQVGDATITKIVDQVIPVPPTYLYPAISEDQARQLLSSLAPENLDGSRTAVAISVHSWLVRVDGHTVLIDTAGGNDKERPQFPSFHR